MTDVFAEEGGFALHQLETVFVSWIVAAGDHHATIGVEVMHGEIEQRCGPDADVDHIDACSGQPVRKRVEQSRRRQSAIASDRDGERFSFRRLLDYGSSKSLARRADEIAREFAICDPSDVVFAKDMRRN